MLTNNGRPVALMLTLTDGNFEDILSSVRQAKAMRALNAIRAEAAERGFLNEDEIEAEIKAYRREKIKNKPHENCNGYKCLGFGVMVCK